MPSTAPPHPASTAAPSAGSGLDIKTLFVTACASAIAAYLCSRLWAPGTLVAAAFTPVVLALIREGLAKSTDAVVRAVPPVRGGVRRTEADGISTGTGTGTGTDTGSPAAGEPTIGDQPLPAPTLVADPGEPIAQQGEIRYHGLRRRGRHDWRLAVVTGMLGFMICAVVLTVPEIVAGGSASGGRNGTTLFGGTRERDDATVTNTTTSRTTTIQTRTVIVPPTRTVTVPAPTTERPRATPQRNTPQRSTTTPSRTTESPPSSQDDEPSTVEPPSAQPPG